MIDAGKDFALIDVREQNEYEIVNIPGAILIPKGRILSGEALAEIPQDKPVVLHCKSGARSAEALAVLHKAGFARRRARRRRRAGLGEAGRPLAADLLSLPVRPTGPGPYRPGPVRRLCSSALGRAGAPGRRSEPIMRTVRGPGARPDGPGSAERGASLRRPGGAMGVAHMDDGGRRCALPGCDRTITTTAGRPERRYCTAAHRAAARRARRAAVPAEQPEGPDPLADALPWLRDAIGTDAARPGDSDDPAAEPVRPLPAEVTPAPEVSSRSRDRRPMPRRRHALALLGVAGILAGGYAVTDAAPEPPPVQTAPEGAAAPDGAAADTWAQRATVALASVNRQLDTLAQTEDEWRRLPESGRAMVPAPVAALEERRSVLQRRRATLQAQLDDYRSLRRTQQELANSEQHLRAVETALADAPPRRRRSAEQEAAIAALEEQRDLRIRRRDVQRTELASLQDGVSTATRTPLPDDGAATATITDDVMEMVHNGGTEPARPDPKPPRPEVVAGRESEDGKPRQEVGTSGPPDPRGPRDESDERRAAKEKRAGEGYGRGSRRRGPRPGRPLVGETTGRPEAGRETPGRRGGFGRREVGRQAGRDVCGRRRGKES